jgi:hypothetical protein
MTKEDPMSTMCMSIYAPTLKERELAKELRRLALKEIEKSDNIDAIAKKLDLKPSGVQTLVKDSTWDLATAVRVAEILDISFEFKL